jgi:heme a synthase
MTSSAITSEYSSWAHRISVLLAWLVFPLIWLGGLVTTYDAGMAVPDWPNTYGYNMFLYPIESWIYGPFDLFVEHGHRLLASLSGVVAIILVVVAQRSRLESWIKRWSWLLLAMIILQGALGGVRVVLDARTVALIHGCVGPAFFALVMIMCVATSKWWHKLRANADGNDLFTDARHSSRAPTFEYVAWALTTTSYLQLIFGACIRHISVTSSPESFRILVLMHIAGAITVLALAISLCIFGVFRRHSLVTPLRSISILILLVVVQIGLGLATWVVKFGFPVWFRNTPTGEFFVITEKSFWQMNIVTLHVAIGSLILALATYVAFKISTANEIAFKSFTKEKA